MNSLLLVILIIICVGAWYNNYRDHVVLADGLDTIIDHLGVEKTKEENDPEAELDKEWNEGNENW